MCDGETSKLRALHWRQINHVRGLRRTLVLGILMFCTGLLGPCLGLRAAETEEQEFTVPVRLMHAYEEGKESMGNPAMGQTASVRETADGAEITLSFEALDFMDMHGHLLKIYSWEGEAKAQVDGSCREAEVLETKEEAGLDGRLTTFPKKVKIRRSKLREGAFYVRVRVDAMDAISGGEGSGEQNAKLVLDYSQAPAALGGQSAAAGEEPSSRNATVEEQASAVDLSQLKPGRYTLPVALWHRYEDRPSMGNAALNPLAMIEVKDQQVYCNFTVHPLAVSGITASLLTFQAEDQEGKMQFAEIVERKLAGDKPSQFRFPLYHGGVYQLCKVDPNVAAMGNQPVDARLKLDWSQLQAVAADYQLQGDTETQYGDVYTPPVNWLDESSQIGLKAEERVLASGSNLHVDAVAEGEVPDSARQFFQRARRNVRYYRLRVLDERGADVQALREVQLSFPVQTSGTEVFLIQPDGTPNAINGQTEAGRLLVRTKHFGLFALSEPGVGGPGLVLVCIAGASLVVLIVLGLFLYGRSRKRRASAQGSQKAGTKHRTGAWLLGLALFLISGSGFLQAASQGMNLPGRGAYLVQIYGSYLDPDTGKTRDGGTQNAEIGEGMVDGVVTPSDPAGGIDSVFGKPKPGEEHYADALIEQRLDGKYFATLRLYLMNFIRFSEADGPFIQVQQADGSYKKVDYAITQSHSEQDGVNYHDFRFELPSPEIKVCVEMYVVPMSRPVKYFVLSTGKYQAGHGDFQAYFVQEDEAYLAEAARRKWLFAGLGLAVLVLAALGGFIVLKKRRQGHEV